jgi:uncharacterized protein YndB with AHSA1/START domain
MKNPTKIIAEIGKQELFIIREFEAPRELVFKAFSEPEYLLQWLGPRNLTMAIDHYESKDGGSWRFLHCSASGSEYGFHGVMHEVTAPERIIRTFEFEGLPQRGHVSLETATFESLKEDRTKLTIHSVFRSVADRDGMIQSGMERGVMDSHARLDELFEKVTVK